MSDSDVMTRWAEPPDLVLRYRDHADQLVDVWLPLHRLGVQRPAGLVAVLHGGFWRQEFDRIHVRPLANALRADGFAVAAIEYRRTGGAGGWPMTFDDVRTGANGCPRRCRRQRPARPEDDDRARALGRWTPGDVGRAPTPTRSVAWSRWRRWPTSISPIGGG